MPLHIRSGHGFVMPQDGYICTYNSQYVRRKLDFDPRHPRGVGESCGIIRFQRIDPLGAGDRCNGPLFQHKILCPPRGCPLFPSCILIFTFTFTLTFTRPRPQFLPTSVGLPSPQDRILRASIERLCLLRLYIPSADYHAPRNQHCCPSPPRPG